MVKRLFSKDLFSNVQLVIGLAVMLLFVLVGLVGPFILPYDPSPVMADKYLPSSWAHPFGTDWLGRDVFREMIAGTRSVLIIAFCAATITVVVGSVLGMLSGFKVDTAVDKVIMMITNMVLSIPSFPVYLMLASIVTIESPVAIALVVAAWSWAGLCMQLRGQVWSLKNRDFIQVCKVMDMGMGHTLFKELMPNIMSYIIVNFVIAMRNAIMVSVGIMLIGLASYEPTNWGAIIAAARAKGLVNPNNVRIVIYPVAALVIFQVAGQMVVNGLDELFNPRIKVL